MNSIIKIVFSIASLSMLILPQSTDAVQKIDERAAIYVTNGELSSTEDDIEDIYNGMNSLLPPGIGDALEGPLGTEGLYELFEAIAKPVEDGIRQITSTALLFFAICIFMCLCELTLSDNGELYGTARGTLCAVLTLPVIGVMGELLSSVSAGIREASAFFSELIPLLGSVIAIGIGGGTAAASAAASA